MVGQRHKGARLSDMQTSVTAPDEWNCHTGTHGGLQRDMVTAGWGQRKRLKYGKQGRAS